MNPFALLSLCSSVICFLLANFIYYKNNTRRENQLFILVCLSVMHWGFVEFMLRQSESEQTAYFWMKAEVSWPFTVALLFHFILYYTEKTKLLKNIFIYVLIYVPAALFSFLDATTQWIASQVVKKYWGYTYILAEKSLFNTLANFWVVTILFLTIALSIHYYIKTSAKLRKIQTFYLIAGLSVPIILGLITERVFSAFRIDFPELTATSMTLMVIILGYAIWKFELFIIDPVTAAENIVFTMPDALVLLNLDLKVVKINQSFINLFGYREKEVFNKPVTLLFKDTASAEHIFYELFNCKSLVNVELEFLTKSGDSFPAYFSASHIKDKWQQIKGIVGIVRDISEQQKSEQKLKEAQHKMIELAHQAGMSEVTAEILHNMGNALNSVGICAEEIVSITNQSKLEKLFKANELLAAHQNDLGSYFTNDPKGKILPEYYLKITEELKKEQHTLQNDAMQLLDKLTVIKDIIGTQQRYTYKVAIMETINLPAIIEEVLRIQQGSFLRYGIKIEKKYLHGNIRIAAQHSKIIHILMNIFRNAVEALQANKPEERFLMIEAGLTDTLNAYIKITDNGEGIAAQNLAHIFSFGFTTKQKGHGFGLHSCANAMSQMDGKISAESAGPGQGASFTLTFNLFRESNYCSL